MQMKGWVRRTSTDTTKKVASDFSIYGIVDSIDMRGARTYDKAKETVACSWQK